MRSRQRRDRLIVRFIIGIDEVVINGQIEIMGINGMIGVVRRGAKMTFFCALPFGPAQ